MGSSSLTQDYERLLSKIKDVYVLGSVAGVIQWDTETKMPRGAFEYRSQMQSLLGRLDQRMATDPEIGELLGRIEKDTGVGSMDEVQRRNLYLIRKDYDEKTKLPERLIAAISRQEVISYQAWHKAKGAKDFSIFKPELERMLELKNEWANLLLDVKGVKNTYDALIDIFEPKFSQETITVVFDRLKAGLLPIIQKCINSPSQPDSSVLKRHVPVAVQERLSKMAMDFIGYETGTATAKGRLDETEHPFTIGVYDDVRITTHYYENSFASSVFSVLHEGGHALYDQDLRREWIYTPVGQPNSYGWHESQSRFIENIVGRSPEFCSYLLPRLKEMTGTTLADLELGKFVHALNEVRPSKIRVEADEVTYSMHLILRFEIERDLLAGKISVGELPQVWNQKYWDYLGMEINDDAEGVLQDVHWAHGYFGYFPSYAIGNIYSGHLLSKLNREMPLWREGIAKGSFAPILGWLKGNVHSLGNLYDPLVMLKRVTGEEIDPSHFVRYLNEKYSRIYSF
jgi:carboxypeptidase Taq